MIKNNLRRCEVKVIPEPTQPHLRKTWKAFFHQWATEAYVIGESALVGGHSAGQVSHTVGIVEYDTGEIEMVHPERIKFKDEIVGGSDEN